MASKEVSSPEFKEVSPQSYVTGLHPDEFASWDEAISHFAGDVVVANEIELVDKATLVGVPFFITNFVFRHDAATDREYVSVEIVTQDNRKLVFNDGSTGVFKTLERHAAEGRFGGIVCRSGLRDSAYGVDKDGVPLPKGSTQKPDSIAHTYYLN